MLVPYGATGTASLNLLNEYTSAGPIPPTAWSAHLVFDASNQVVYDSFGGQSVPLIPGSWIEVTADIDLLADEASIYYDGILLDRRPWRVGGAGQLALAAANFDGGSLTPGMFVDDLLLKGDEDCDGNGMTDGCDIATGAATDCNGNGRIDACEIAGGAADCNANGVPDECDEDCNANGEPDDCESPPYPDFDGDGVVGSSDHTAFYNCFTGPCSTVTCAPPLYSAPCCVLGDSDGDGDIDLVDFAAFQVMYTGGP